MALRRALTALSLIIVLSACWAETERQVPSHAATFFLDTSRYPLLLDAMDNALSPFGLTRHKAGPGLQELHGREVLFAAYLSTGASKKVALDLTDVMAKGKVTLRVYVNFTPSEERRATLLQQVATVLAQFGGTLEAADGK